MQTPTTDIPPVLVLAGHDPSGGAGIQADIEALASNGCHALPVITALTVQNTARFEKVVPVDADLFRQQLQVLVEDIPIAACKIGLLADVRIVQIIHDCLKEHPDLPVILDPVLASGTGTPVANQDLIAIIRELLLPLTTIITPNSLEARQLSGKEVLADCAGNLIAAGCGHVLITGSHEQTDTVVNSLYDTQGLVDTFECERLPGEYHGSGCTLASALTALLAREVEMETAVIEAIRYTMETLRHAHAPGQGQLIPDRFFWSRDAE